MSISQKKTEMQQKAHEKMMQRKLQKEEEDRLKWEAEEKQRQEDLEKKRKKLKMLEKQVNSSWDYKFNFFWQQNIRWKDDFGKSMKEGVRLFQFIGILRNHGTKPISFHTQISPPFPHSPRPLPAHNRGDLPAPALDAPDPIPRHIWHGPDQPRTFLIRLRIQGLPGPSGLA